MDFKTNGLRIIYTECQINYIWTLDNQLMQNLSTMLSIFGAFEGFIVCNQLHFSWRNEKATFKEKKIEIATDKLPGHDHEADHIFVGLPEEKSKL